jgi:DNA polymerase-3 subunit delta'
LSSDLDTESDQQAGCLHPRERYDLFGHDDAETRFAHAFQSGRLHHAWLITGPRGVGKASFAWRAIRRVLGAARDDQSGPLGSDPADPVCKQLEAQSCPDLLVLRRPWDEKRKRWRAEITVEESRRAPHFFEKSASAGAWRACLVDSADDMNVNASNALLKTLEEPPRKGVLFLIAHSPGRLPATIRSRCRRLDLRAPSVEATASWLKSAGGPTQDDAALAAASMAAGAPGRALALAACGGVELSQAVDQVMARGASAVSADLRALADRVTARGAEGLRPIFYEALGKAMQARAKQAAERGEAPDAWLRAWRELNTLVRDADRLYLDAKQTALTALNLIREAARTERV